MTTQHTHYPQLNTSVTPAGEFLVGLHRPSFTVANLRQNDRNNVLGHTEDGNACRNDKNFPTGDLQVPMGRPIYEIRNAFSFRGATFIDSSWADNRAGDPLSIRIPEPEECSLRRSFAGCLKGEYRDLLGRFPRSILYGLAATSTDPDELVLLADSCCRLEYNEAGEAVGLRYLKEPDGKVRADIDDFELFETIANNPYLPDTYKKVMVLIPGVQGDSAIVGEQEEATHVYEYLRANSYIPGGHYAANLADDRICYRTSELTKEDMAGMRRLYYQRIFVMLADRLGVPCRVRRRGLSRDELEMLRRQVNEALQKNPIQAASLWGWNFGYDFSASGYRLHASHQMIHQQYAMVPETVASVTGRETLPAFGCGDLVAETVKAYAAATNSDFFRDFLWAIRNNTRTDNSSGEDNLVVWEDENVLLFVPKAQVSQWELQLMVTADTEAGPVGNVIEADAGVRDSLDTGILTAQKIYAGLGARMVTSIEFPKRFCGTNGQRLLYSFLPKLPWSMGAFSEAQQRYICGHYPEDFAICCRARLEKI